MAATLKTYLLLYIEFYQNFDPEKRERTSSSAVTLLSPPPSSPSFLPFRSFVSSLHPFPSLSCGRLLFLYFLSFPLLFPSLVFVPKRTRGVGQLLLSLPPGVQAFIPSRLPRLSKTTILACRSVRIYEQMRLGDDEEGVHDVLSFSFHPLFSSPSSSSPPYRSLSFFSFLPSYPSPPPPLFPSSNSPLNGLWFLVRTPVP